ncbi:MAG: hypothetical protein SVR08_14345 [Spirochaetota bacterium]|nr:hypothetical protein [Spirochaetota bacterium]
MDIIYDNMQAGDSHKEKILRNESSIEKQHIEIMGILDAVKEGFKNVDKRFETFDKRFEDLIHQIDKRFDDANKRFSLLTWLIGIGFISVNILIVILKFLVN